MYKKVLLWLIENGLRLNTKAICFLADALVLYHDNKNIKIMEMYEIIGNAHRKSVTSIGRNIHQCLESDWHRTTFKKYTKGSPTVFEAIQLLELLYPWSDNND